jgi:hypothetical protein
MNRKRLSRRARLYLWAALQFGLACPLCYVLNLMVAIWSALSLRNHFSSGDLYDAVAVDFENFKREHARLKEIA